MTIPSASYKKLNELQDSAGMNTKPLVVNVCDFSCGSGESKELSSSSGLIVNVVPFATFYADFDAKSYTPSRSQAIDTIVSIDTADNEKNWLNDGAYRPFD